ncbi:exosortase O [Tychonema sp. BBK16]|uniref:exosortase O n=1 Tax=Tychonema sp. BBK16 TaxID=2699888 RepID=UPI001F3A41E8|nr:exosortase O [Tychonema sp. BBK16]MCF6372113.1 exosortase O [Tychonema sp. BBK16]
MSSGIMQRTKIPDSGISDSVSPHRAVNLVGLAPFLLPLTWFFANLEAVKWLLSSFVEIPTLYKILISLLIVALVVRSIGSSGRSHRSIPKLIVRRYPVLLMLSAGICSIALQCIIDIKHITVLLFILGTYGLYGLFCDAYFWQKNLPVAGLLACILPFNSQLNSGLGLPARVLTAQVVEQLLSVLQIGAISSYDIIVLENGIAHVDVPCSGIKTLFVGTLFLLAATWIESRKLGLKWLALCVANFLMLVSANAARVAVLVLVAQVFQQPMYAEILHVPLGIVGLVSTCFLTWLMLQKIPKFSEFPASNLGAEDNSEIFINQPFAKLGVIAVVGVLAIISQLYHVESAKVAIAPMNIPPQIVSESIALNPSEQTFFGNYPGTKTEKIRFVSGNLRGSMLTVASTSWQTYHAPELCFIVSGIPVNRIERKQLTSDILARWLSLKNNQLSATYWLQSTQGTTDNFLSRISSDIRHKNQTWVLVSILFDSSLNPESSEIQDFVTSIHNAVNLSLKG